MKFYKKNNTVISDATRYISLSIITFLVAIFISGCGPKKAPPQYDAKSQKLISEYKELSSLEQRFEAGNTALLVATEKNLPSVVNYLLERGAKVDVQNKNGTTPLMVAASRGNAEIVAMLIAHKANINTTDKFGYTAMFYAVEQKSAAVIKRLLAAGANPNIKGEFGWTVIMVLAGERAGYLSTIKKFHNKGVSLNAAENQFGLTALAINSMLQGDYSVFKYLVDNGANINRIDKLKRTPLLYAMVNKNYPKIRYLINKGANPRLGLYKGLTPLMFAAARGNSYIVKLLVDSGAKPKFRNKHGKSAIDYARKRRFRRITSYLKKH